MLVFFASSALMPCSMNTKDESGIIALRAKRSATACRDRILRAGIVLFLSLNAISGRVEAQGCVQSRGAGTCMMMPGESIYLQPGEWQAAIGYRWLHSDSPFIGGTEQN